MQLPSYFPGFRIIKTFIAVLICLLICFIFKYYRPVYAILACILMMKESSQSTKQLGIFRLIGTLIGGSMALAMLVLAQMLKIMAESYFMAVLVSLAVLLDLWLCKILKQDSYVYSMAAVVSSIILLSYASQVSALNYVISRMLETGFGILVAYLVNHYLNFPMKQL